MSTATTAEASDTRKPAAKQRPHVRNLVYMPQVNACHKTHKAMHYVNDTRRCTREALRE